MVTVKNNVRSIPFSTQNFLKKAEALLEFLDYQDFDLGIWLTTNRTIQKYNKKFRHKDKPTDVLSFPYHEKLKAGQSIKIKTPEDKNLGDILISVPFVWTNPLQLPGIFPDRMDYMLVHGLSHLLGYDHQTDKQHAQMLQFEQKLLQQLRKIS